MSSQNSHVEALIPDVMVFGDGAFGRWLGLDEVMRLGPHDGISALIRRDTRSLSLSLHISNSRQRQEPSLDI